MKFAQNAYYWQGEKVRIRSMRDTDVDAKWDEYADSRARQQLEYGVELPVAAKEKYAAAFAEPMPEGIVDLYIETLDGTFVGWINIHSMNKKNGTFSLGASIFEAYRGRGYGEEAAALVLRYCFYELRFQKCNTDCLADNVGSIRMQKKLGFKEEGVRRRNVYTGGKFIDVVLFGLTREEFDRYWADKGRGGMRETGG